MIIKEYGIYRLYGPKIITFTIMLLVASSAQTPTPTFNSLKIRKIIEYQSGSKSVFELLNWV